MPLRAIVNNEGILAPFLDDEAWQLLKTRVKNEHLDVRLPCCGNVAYLRTSKHGVKHFVHKERDTCTSAPETWQHLKAKHEIVLACKAAGYDTITEVSGDGWRADVLAVKGKVKIAFEIQWSSQTWEETQERQQKYKEAGIRGCWLFKRPPVQYRANNEVPLFKLEITEDAAIVIFNPYSYEYESYDRRINLSEFVTALLHGKIKFCDHLTSLPRQTVRMIFVETRCWKCFKLFHVYYVKDLVTGCGDELKANCFDPQFVAIAISLRSDERYSHIETGDIKERYSKTAGEKYMSFGCPQCDAIVGDFFLFHEIFPEARYSEDKAPAIWEKEITLRHLVSSPDAHWCFPEGGQFCGK